MITITATTAIERDSHDRPTSGFSIYYIFYTFFGDRKTVTATNSLSTLLFCFLFCKYYLETKTKINFNYVTEFKTFFLTLTVTD